jgi:hypothetical protein
LKGLRLWLVGLLGDRRDLQKQGSALDWMLSETGNNPMTK